MGKKKEKPVDMNALTEEEKLKYEIGRKTKSDKNVKIITKCEYLVSKVEKDRSFCYNRQPEGIEGDYQ